MFRINSVRTKIIALSICAIILTAISLVSIVLMEKTHLKKNVFEELDKLAQSETSKIAKDVYLMCQVTNDMLIESLHADLNFARKALADKGEIAFSNETTQWNAINQVTNQAVSVSLPKMLIGNTWVGSKF